MSEKIYLDLTDREKKACEWLCASFLFKLRMGIQFQHYNSITMAEIFNSLYVENCIEVKNIELFIDYCHCMGKQLVKDAVTKTFSKYSSDADKILGLVTGMLSLQNIAVKLEKRIVEEAIS